MILKFINRIKSKFNKRKEGLKKINSDYPFLIL